ncbi:MAG: diguanylate cyclase [Desulfobacterales bacterium]|nr:diguanylate cyclase [Desulfobacterales bacterium]MDX2509693.1 diguanylate cyclase [Desulfobacterales bacterium]
MQNQSTKKLIEQVKHNDEITRKFFEIEKRILSILNYKDLFESLLREIKIKFNMPYAWISIIEKSDLFNFIQSLETSDILKKHMNIVDKNTFLKLVGTKTTPLLINDNLKAYSKLIPRQDKHNIRSIAISPISLDGEIIGSLNQAHILPGHFKPGLDTSSLEQLAVKVSFCLSNVTAHEKLKFLAYIDSLTGLLNRRAMENALKREFSREKRYKRMLTVVFIDLDDFKSVNDIYGHDRGDELLKYVARQLFDISRDTDIVARFAGDEFIFILPETSAASTKTLMNRLKDFFISHPLDTAGTSIPVSISFGVASTEDKSIENPTMLLKKADEMLYQAKADRKTASTEK